MNWDAASQEPSASKKPIYEPVPLDPRVDPTIVFFVWLLCLHVVGWTIVTAVTQPNAPAETLELLTATGGAAWGYAEHPPLTVWVAKLSTAVTAPSVWPAYVVSHLCTAVCMACVWYLGRKFLHPWTAICAAMVLEGCFVFTISSAVLTDAHIASAFWCVSVLTFHSALTRPRRRYWMATGLLLGFGFLASYATALLLLAMFVFTLLDERARRCWDSSWPFLAILVGTIIVIPHVIWLWYHDFITIWYAFPISTSGTDHFIHPVRFVFTQALAVIPLLFVLGPLVSWFNLDEEMGSSEDDREFVRRYLLWVTCLPPAVLVAASVVSGSSSGVFEGISFWAFAGISWLLWGHIAENKANWRRVLLRTGAVAGCLVAIMVVVNVMLPTIQEQASSVHFPGEKLARHVQATWSNSGYDRSPPIISGPSQLVQNASWYSGAHTRPLAYTSRSEDQRRAAEDKTLRQVGGVVLWQPSEDGSAEANIRTRFVTAEFLEPVEFKWQTTANVAPVRVAMAIVHPEISEEYDPYPVSDPVTDGSETTDDSIMPVDFVNHGNPSPTVSPAGYTEAAAQPVVENPFMRFSGTTIPEKRSSTIPESTIPRSAGAQPTSTIPSTSIPRSSIPSSTIPRTAPTTSAPPAQPEEQPESVLPLF